MEYSQCIERYITPKDLAKMARGEMVRFMAENNISDLKDITDFQELGFDYSVVNFYI